MRANLLHITQAALAEGRSVAAVTVYDFTTAQGVVAASESSSNPVILLVPPSAAAGLPGARFIRALRGLADVADVQVCVQLDHAKDLGLIGEAVIAGADSVLADGSNLGHKENAALVRSARSLVGPDVVIEAELGSIGGDEDRALDPSGSVSPAGLTDPAHVNGFLEDSGADLLAVAVGNVHGRYKGDPHLDWERIAAIRTAAGSTPLVLHGASGIPRTDLQRAGGAGVGKININTELRTRIFEVLERDTDSFSKDGLNMVGLNEAWFQAAELFVQDIQTVLAPA